jgi:hypothetical protein
VHNNSDLAIWGLRLEWHLGITPMDRTDEIPQLAAGKEVVVERQLNPGDGKHRFEADLVFRDAAGITWRRKISGELEEIPRPQPGADSDHAPEATSLTVRQPHQPR